jgi:hypothetical protein
VSDQEAVTGEVLPPQKTVSIQYRSSRVPARVREPKVNLDPGGWFGIGQNPQIADHNRALLGEYMAARETIYAETLSEALEAEGLRGAVSTMGEIQEIVDDAAIEHPNSVVLAAAVDMASEAVKRVKACRSKYQDSFDERANGILNRHR